MTLKKYGDKISGSNDYRVIRLPFTVNKVYCVYIGKVGCTCGCGGKYYYYRDITKKEKWQISGDQKTNTRMIKFAYNKIKTLAKTREHGIEVIDDYIYSWEGERRAIRIYLHD